MVRIKIENHDVLPREVKYFDFDTIDDLLLFLTDTDTRRNVHITTVGHEYDPTWLIYIESDREFLHILHKEDGMCGICGAMIDPDKEAPLFNRDTDDGNICRNFVYCDYCGHKLVKKQGKSLSDLFYEGTRQINIEYPAEEFVPIPCGNCQGKGDFPIVNDWGYPIGGTHPCPACMGKKFITINNIMQL